jgi:hypothetical protein
MIRYASPPYHRTSKTKNHDGADGGNERIEARLSQKACSGPNRAARQVRQNGDTSNRPGWVQGQISRPSLGIIRASKAPVLLLLAQLAVLPSFSRGIMAQFNKITPES